MLWSGLKDGAVRGALIREMSSLYAVGLLAVDNGLFKFLGKATLQERCVRLPPARSERDQSDVKRRRGPGMNPVGGACDE